MHHHQLFSRCAFTVFALIGLVAAAPIATAPTVAAPAAPIGATLDAAASGAAAPITAAPTAAAPTALATAAVRWLPRMATRPIALRATQITPRAAWITRGLELPLGLRLW